MNLNVQTIFFLYLIDDFLLHFLGFAIGHNLFENIKYHVVAGLYNERIDDLRRLERDNKNITIYSNVSDMAALMAMCDIAVSAAGTILYECCSIGIPTIFYCLSDDQTNEGLYFSRDAGMIYAGDARTDMQSTVRNVFSGISYLMGNKKAKEKMQDKLLRVVDGQGADRIAQELILL